MDTYYLNDAVYLLENYLKTTSSPAWAGSITYGRASPTAGWARSRCRSASR